MAKYNIVRRMVTDNLQPQNTIENVTEFIAKEIAKAPLAHDGVPYQNDQPQNDQQ